MWSVAPLLVVLSIINLGAGFVICRRFSLRRFRHVAPVGIGLYLASSFAMAAAAAVRASLTPLAAVQEAVGVALYGAVLFSPFCVPFILLLAWLASRQLKKGS